MPSARRDDTNVSLAILLEISIEVAGHNWHGVLRSNVYDDVIASELFGCNHPRIT